MSTLPADADIQPSVTVGNQKAHFASWLKATRQMPGGGPAQALTIVAGVVTPADGVSTHLKVDTEGATASDQLDRVAITNLPEGSRLFVQAANDARTVIVHHGVGGSGQFLLSNAADFSLDDDDKFIEFELIGTSWTEIRRGFGADVAAERAFLGLGTAALVNTGSSAGNVPLVSNILGKKTLDVAVDAMRPQTTHGCAPHIQVELTADQPELVALDFDGTTQENAFFSVAMPKGWDLGTIEARFYYVVNAAVSTGVVWGIQAVSRADNEALNAAYGTAQVIADTYLGTANKLAVTGFTPAVTVGGTPADGERVYFRVFRDPANGSDTTTQDARLIAVQMRYTVNALNDS